MKPPKTVGDLSSDHVSELLAMGLPEDEGEVLDSTCISLLEEIDEEAIQRIITDLRRPVLDADRGPLSFQRLVSPPGDIEQELASCTILDVLTSVTSSLDALESLVDYGKLLLASPLPLGTRRTGFVIYVSAKTAITTLHGLDLDETVRSATASVFRVFQSIERNSSQ